MNNDNVRRENKEEPKQRLVGGEFVSVGEG